MAGEGQCQITYDYVLLGNMPGLFNRNSSTCRAELFLFSDRMPTETRGNKKQKMTKDERRRLKTTDNQQKTENFHRIGIENAPFHKEQRNSIEVLLDGI